MLTDLNNPPIVEVVCGFVFDELVALDPLLVGQFWSRKRGAYPKREVRPPVRTQPGFAILEGVGPVRSWLVSAGDEFVIQIQPDRFYFNWRRKGDAYPRFGTHEGRDGVLARASSEFAEFVAYCQEELKQAPVVRSVELAKIDLVRYSSDEELGQLVPSLTAFRTWTKSGSPEINIQIAERSDETDLLVLISNAVVTPDLSSAVRVETRASRALTGGEPEKVFGQMNLVLNATFERVFSEAAMKRFREVSA